MHGQQQHLCRCHKRIQNIVTKHTPKFGSAATQRHTRKRVPFRLVSSTLPYTTRANGHCDARRPVRARSSDGDGDFRSSPPAVAIHARPLVPAPAPAAARVAPGVRERVAVPRRVS
jgi:hypothetical protein